MSRRKFDFKACLFTVLAIFVGAVAFASDGASKTRYHVSYLWHHDLDRVQDYRREVGALLGPAVAKRLRVVANRKLFGLIYLRRGDSIGAVRAAKSHTRILRRAGLHTAAPVREGRWTLLDPSRKLPQRLIIPVHRRSITKTARYYEARDLEAAIEQYIKSLRRKGLLTADERTGWSVYDFTTDEKLVTINEDVQFQAASLIKPFIAAAFFHRVRNGAIIYGPVSRHHMKRMIHLSDNRSANWVIRQVGGPRAVQRILRTHYSSIFHDTRIVEYIPASGKTYRNRASVHDYSRFLHALWNSEIPGAGKIRRLMALPGSDRIVTGAKGLSKVTKVYNKTGSTAHLCGDMGIVIVKGPDGQSYPYTVVGVIQKQRKARNYTAWIRSRGDIIRNVSKIVYKGITRHHEFGNDL